MAAVSEDLNENHCYYLRIGLSSIPANHLFHIHHA